MAVAALASAVCAWFALPDGVGTAAMEPAAAAGVRAAASYFLGPHLFFAAVWPLLQARRIARAALESVGVAP